MASPSEPTPRTEAGPLTDDELQRLRIEAEAEQSYPGKHGQWERLVLRLLATLAQARTEALDVDALIAELSESPLPGARYAVTVVKAHVRPPHPRGDTVTEPTPRTEAGRRLLVTYGGNPDGAMGRAILAIEAQARTEALDVDWTVPVTTGVDADLSEYAAAEPSARSDVSLEGYWERAYWEVVPKLQAALAAEPPALDVERLTMAVHVLVERAWGGKGASHAHQWCRDEAEGIAAEYARLTREETP